MAAPSTHLSEILLGVLNELSAGLAAAGAPAGLVHLAPGGEVAWDLGCHDAQLYLLATEIFPVMGPGGPAFPNRDTTQRGNCPPGMIGVSLRAGVLRCVSTVDDNGTAPSAEAMTGEAVTGLLDMHTLMETLTCAVPAIPGVARLSLEKWAALGPRGGVAGGEWWFTIAVAACIDCG